ncbi:MAG: cytochrome d ubiquinol oxidase subunit II [Gemmatimonadaceae bacterium]
MPDPLLPYLLAFVTMLALNAYVVLGGADFGAGVWDLLARGPRKDVQREAIAHGIGPIWEANHVWLILVVVLLFTCFPAVYAYLSVALHVPLVLMLIGIVLRGSAFTFRAYDSTNSPVQRWWGRIFSIASTVTPIVLGMIVGAIVSGAIVTPEGATFTERFLSPWLTPFAVAVGGLTVAVFAFLAAVYLTVEAETRDLQEDFRRNALSAAVVVGACALAALIAGRETASELTDSLLTHALAFPLQIVTGVAALAALAALITRRYRVARAAAVVQVSAIVWGWGIAQFPWMVPGVHSITSAAAPEVTQRLVAYGLAAGALLVVPSLWVLFSLFKSDRMSAFERVDTAEYPATDTSAPRDRR